MNGLVLLIISVAVLVVGYIFYGRWLCKQWGVGELDKQIGRASCRERVSS